MTRRVRQTRGQTRETPLRGVPSTENQPIDEFVGGPVQGVEPETECDCDADIGYQRQTGLIQDLSDQPVDDRERTIKSALTTP